MLGKIWKKNDTKGGKKGPESMQDAKIWIGRDTLITKEQILNKLIIFHNIWLLVIKFLV